MENNNSLKCFIVVRLLHGWEDIASGIETRNQAADFAYRIRVDVFDVPFDEDQFLMDIWKRIHQPKEDDKVNDIDYGFEVRISDALSKAEAIKLMDFIHKAPESVDTEVEVPYIHEGTESTRIEIQEDYSQWRDELVAKIKELEIFRPEE
jgi:hypothetical protein